MAQAEEILEKAAKDGSFDPKEWPTVLETVISRLDHIFYNEFPRPSIQPDLHQSIVPSTLPGTEVLSSQESQSANKENAPPSTPPARPPVPPFSTHASTSSSPPVPAHQYPPDLIALLAYIRNSLTKNFPKNPPHTIQRLAELILSPRAHYRYLPPYLHALERVVSVSSPTTIFPLPQAVLPSNAGLINGSYHANNNTLGSDESLGGALLTPIPWLRPDRSSQEREDSTQGSELISESTEMVDGPNGAGRIETVTVSNGVVRMGNQPNNGPASRVVPSQQQHNPDALRDSGAVTQGELLRQEQEAGVVPTNQTQTRAHAQSTEDRPNQDGEPGLPTAEDDEQPHARGPSEIGPEDMGPQGTRAAPGELNIAAAVGRPASEEVKSPPVTASGSGTEQKAEVEMTDADAEGEPEAGTTASAEGESGKEEKEKDGDGDYVLVDAENKAEDGGEEKEKETEDDKA